MMKSVFFIILIAIAAVVFAQSSSVSSSTTTMLPLGFQPAEIRALVTPLGATAVTYLAGSFSCYSGCSKGDTLSFTFNSTTAKISSVDIVLYDIKNNQPMITLPKGKKMVNIQVKNNRIVDFSIPWVNDMPSSLGQNVMFNAIVRYEQLPSVPTLYDQIEFKYTPPTLASSVAYCQQRFAQNPTKLGGAATVIFMDNKNPNDTGELILDAKDLTANTVGIVVRIIGGHQKFISQSKDILTNPNDQSQIAFLTSQGSIQGAYKSGELLIERPFVQITNAFPLLWHPSTSTSYIEMSFVTEEEKQYLDKWDYPFKYVLSVPLDIAFDADPPKRQEESTERSHGILYGDLLICQHQVEHTTRLIQGDGNEKFRLGLYGNKEDTFALSQEGAIGDFFTISNNNNNNDDDISSITKHVQRTFQWDVDVKTVEFQKKTLNPIPSPTTTLAIQSYYPFEILKDDTSDIFKDLIVTCALHYYDQSKDYPDLFWSQLSEPTKIIPTAVKHLTTSIGGLYNISNELKDFDFALGFGPLLMDTADILELEIYDSLDISFKQSITQCGFIEATYNENNKNFEPINNSAIKPFYAEKAEFDEQSHIVTWTLNSTTQFVKGKSYMLTHCDNVVTPNDKNTTQAGLYNNVITTKFYQSQTKLESANGKVVLPYPSRSTKPDDGDDKHKPNLIALAVIIGIVALIILGLFINWCWKKRQKKQREEAQLSYHLNALSDDANYHAF